MKDPREFELPGEVQGRVRAMGDEAVAWMNELPATVTVLSGKWKFTPGQVFAGGTESLIIDARLESGAEAIVKIGLPGSCDCVHEAKLLRLAGGRGYVELYDADQETNALLLEKLGDMLASRTMSVDERIERLCGVMEKSWVGLMPFDGLMTGAEKAIWLAEFIQKDFENEEVSCDRETLELAVTFCHERADAHDDAKSCLVHGDVHDQNALFSRDGELKLIDPDGLFAEPACDLAVPMREWSDELLAGDVRQLGIARCRKIADLTGVDMRAIWQWGFMERVSSGLMCLALGMEEVGRDMLKVADEFRAVREFR